MCISMISKKSYLATSLIFGLSCSVIFLMCGCVSYKVPTESFINETGTNDQALSHWLYSVVPRHSSQIEWYDAGHWLSWSLLGNDDDGLFGEESNYKPDQPIGISKAARWFGRNPFHNFCFYVIGSSDRANEEYILLKASGSQVAAFRKSEKPSNFGDKDTSFLAALHGNKPFVSLRIAWSQDKKSEFYLGWRERGNFGVKCVFLGHRQPQQHYNDKIVTHCAE